MHGVPKELVEQQAGAIGLPVRFIHLPEAPGMESYEAAIHQFNLQLKEEGYTHVISGDIFLEDLKQYRKELYEKDGLTCLFPLWGRSSDDIMDEFFSEGFRAVVIAVNGEVLEKNYCGRWLDASFVQSLPSGVDVCGENGEYHSFVTEGPLFTREVKVNKGTIRTQSYPRPLNDEKECFLPDPDKMEFHFLELLP